MHLVDDWASDQIAHHRREPLQNIAIHVASRQDRLDIGDERINHVIARHWLLLVCTVSHRHDSEASRTKQTTG